jgi:hypothetical protein
MTRTVSLPLQFHYQRKQLRRGTRVAFHLHLAFTKETHCET